MPVFPGGYNEKTTYHGNDKALFSDSENSEEIVYIKKNTLKKQRQAYPVSTYNMTEEDDSIFADGTFNINLLSVSGIEGKQLIIKNIGTGIITIIPDGSETIDSAANFVISSQYDGIKIEAGTTEWYII